MTRRTARARLPAASRWAIGGFAILAASCVGGAPPSSTEPVRAVDAPAETYVAVGASESAGVGTDDPFREAWPRLFWREALPASTVYFGFAEPGSTTAQAIREQVPEAVATEPTIATVWLNVNDLVAEIDPSTYEAQLRGLVHALSRGGRTEVLVANTPQLHRLPLFLTCGDEGGSIPPECPTSLPRTKELREGVAAYNQAIARVVADEGAILVDLHALGSVPDTHPEYISEDGFHPSPEGAAAVAREFQRALDGGP